MIKEQVLEKWLSFRGRSVYLQLKAAVLLGLLALYLGGTQLFEGGNAEILVIPSSAFEVEGGALVLNDGRSYLETAPLPVDTGAKSLEVLVQQPPVDAVGACGPLDDVSSGV